MHLGEAAQSVGWRPSKGPLELRSGPWPLGSGPFFLGCSLGRPKPPSMGQSGRPMARNGVWGMCAPLAEGGTSRGGGCACGEWDLGHEL